MRKKFSAALVGFAAVVMLVVSSACTSSPTSPTSDPSAPTRIIGLEIRIQDGSLLGKPIPPEGVAMDQGVAVNLIYSVPETGRVVRISFEVTCVSGPPYTRENSGIPASDTGERKFGFTYWPSTSGEHKIVSRLVEDLGTQSREGTFIVR